MSLKICNNIESKLDKIINDACIKFYKKFKLWKYEFYKKIKINKTLCPI